MRHEGYKCSFCKQEGSIAQKTTFWRFPKILVVQLKRFQIDHCGQRKISAHVTIPVELDLRKYAPFSGKP